MSRLRRATRRLMEDEKQVLDESEQDELLDLFSSHTTDQDQFYKMAFLTIMLLPSPVYITLPYCRHNSQLSLLSLVSIFISAFSLYKVNKKISIFSVVLATVISGSGILEHWPLMRWDYVWVLPIINSIVSIVVIKWLDDMMVEIADLTRKRYKVD